MSKKLKTLKIENRFFSTHDVNTLGLSLSFKYIKTRPYSNKILSQNFKPIKRKKRDLSRKNSRVKFWENGLRNKNFLMDVFR